MKIVEHPDFTIAIKTLHSLTNSAYLSDNRLTVLMRIDLDSAHVINAFEKGHRKINAVILGFIYNPTWIIENTTAI